MLKTFGYAGHCSPCADEIQISIERQQEYTDLPLEPGGARLRPRDVQRPQVGDVLPPEPTWLTAGRVELRNVSVTYASDAQPALDRVSLTIEAGEKVPAALHGSEACAPLLCSPTSWPQIGVVGRTGAGKTTLLVSLWRMVPWSGSITIDGRSIVSMPLVTLRSAMAVVPQVLQVLWVQVAVLLYELTQG